MRTTLDIPDELFKRAKLTAMLEGVSLKSVIARTLKSGFEASAAGSREPGPTSGAGRKAGQPVSEAWASVRELLEEGWATKPPGQTFEYRNPHKQKILNAIHTQQRRR
jgi:hypothetical protein